jgi:hypothetical protein
VSADREEMDKQRERAEAFHEWFKLIRKTVPEDLWIDLVRSRLQMAEHGDERVELRSLLTTFAERGGPA